MVKWVRVGRMEQLRVWAEMLLQVESCLYEPLGTGNCIINTGFTGSWTNHWLSNNITYTCWFNCLLTLFSGGNTWTRFLHCIQCNLPPKVNVVSTGSKSHILLQLWQYWNKDNTILSLRPYLFFIYTPPEQVLMQGILSLHLHNEEVIRPITVGSVRPAIDQIVWAFWK
mgnify:CR=1 FL=1